MERDLVSLGVQGQIDNIQVLRNYVYLLNRAIIGRGRGIFAAAREH